MPLYFTSGVALVKVASESFPGEPFHHIVGVLEIVSEKYDKMDIGFIVEMVSKTDPLGSRLYSEFRKVS